MPDDLLGTMIKLLGMSDDSWFRFIQGFSEDYPCFQKKQYKKKQPVDMKNLKKMIKEHSDWKCKSRKITDKYYRLECSFPGYIPISIDVSNYKGVTYNDELASVLLENLNEKGVIDLLSTLQNIGGDPGLNTKVEKISTARKLRCDMVRRVLTLNLDKLNKASTPIRFTGRAFFEPLTTIEHDGIIVEISADGCLGEVKNPIFQKTFSAQEECDITKIFEKIIVPYADYQKAKRNMLCM